MVETSCHKHDSLICITAAFVDCGRRMTHKCNNLYSTIEMSMTCRDRCQSQILMENCNFAPVMALGGPRQNTAITFGIEKLEWCGYPVRKFWRYVYTFRQNTWMWRTDRWTDILYFFISGFPLGGCLCMTPRPSVCRVPMLYTERADRPSCHLTSGSLHCGGWLTSTGLLH